MAAAEPTQLKCVLHFARPRGVYSNGAGLMNYLRTLLHWVGREFILGLRPQRNFPRATLLSCDEKGKSDFPEATPQWSIGTMLLR